MTFEESVYRHLKIYDYWWPIHELEYEWRADFIAFKKGGQIIEVEVKKTWADYKKDRKKNTGDRWEHATGGRHGFVVRPPVSKYDWLCGDYECLWRPNFFAFAAPEELAKRIAADPDRPKGFGVWSGRYIEPDDESQYESWRGSWSFDRIAPARRLVKMRSEWVSAYRAAAFTRAMWFMSNHFKFEEAV